MPVLSAQTTAQAMNALTVLIPLMLTAAAPDDAKAGKFGAILSEKAIVRVSSTCGYDTPETHLNLVRGPAVPCAFHTAQEKEPWVTLKLPAASEVRALPEFARHGIVPLTRLLSSAPTCLPARLASR